MGEMVGRWAALRDRSRSTKFRTTLWLDSERDESSRTSINSVISGLSALPGLKELLVLLEGPRLDSGQRSSDVADGESPAQVQPRLFNEGIN